jgi:ORF6N domain
MTVNKQRASVRRTSVVRAASIERRIYFVRSQKVMTDNDLAVLYRVPTGAFNQAVRRNIRRFPADFMFQLTSDETENLRSQSVISSWGGRRYLPFVSPNRASRCSLAC